MVAPLVTRIAKSAKLGNSWALMAAPFLVSSWTVAINKTKQMTNTAQLELAEAVTYEITNMLATAGHQVLMISKNILAEYLPNDESIYRYSVVVMDKLSIRDALSGAIFKRPATKAIPEKETETITVEVHGRKFVAVVHTLGEAMQGAMAHNPLTALDLNNLIYCHESVNELAHRAYAECVGNKVVFLSNCLTMIQRYSSGIPVSKSGETVVNSRLVVHILYFMAMVYNHEKFSGVLAYQELNPILQKIAISGVSRNGVLLHKAFELAVAKGMGLSNNPKALQDDTTDEVGRVFFNGALIDASVGFRAWVEQSKPPAQKSNAIEIEELTFSVATNSYPELKKFVEAFNT